MLVFPLDSKLHRVLLDAIRKFGGSSAHWCLAPRLHPDVYARSNSRGFCDICMLHVSRPARTTSAPRYSEIQTESELLIDRHLLRLGAIYALLYVGGMLVSVIGPSFVFEELGGSAIDFGQLESAWSAGSILGAILLIPLVRVIDIPILQLIILALTAFSFAALKMVDLPWALLAFAVLGILYNLGRVAVEVTLQSSIPRATLGRAKGALHCTGMFLGLILFGIGAVFSDEISPSTIFLVFAGILAVGTTALTVFRIGPQGLKRSSLHLYCSCIPATKRCSNEKRCHDRDRQE